MENQNASKGWPLSSIVNLDDVDDFAFHSLNNMLKIWGFQFETTRSVFNEKAKSQAATDEDTPIIVFENMQLYEKCHQESDLTLFIYVFLKYGSVRKTLNEAGAAAEALTRKFALYEIKSGTSSEHKLKFELTLSRIARAFPVHAARLVLKEKFQGVLTFSAFFKQEPPLLMQHTIFPGLIPVKKFTDELKRIASVLNMEISVKLSSPEKKQDMMAKAVGDLIMSSNRYLFEAIQSRLDTDDEKLEILTEAGIVEVNSNGELELSPTTVALLNKFWEIKKLFSMKYSEAVNMSMLTINDV